MMISTIPNRWKLRKKTKIITLYGRTACLANHTVPVACLSTNPSRYKLCSPRLSRHCSSKEKLYCQP
uniref:Uncharacterized protein n=1 Tax=Triticum urartu TaxID=4572 RepID=A0A8R7TI23_TRIUA